jgi:acetyltransferase-like isoleucine patch superfamily enzyme
MLIAGLGGNCKDSLADMVHQFTPSGVAFYTDDPTDKNIPFFEQAGLVVYKGEAQARQYFANNQRNFVSFIGNNYAREKQAAILRQWGGIPSKFMSKSAILNVDLCTISDHNVIIMDFAHVSAGSIIEEGATIYSYTAIAHDVRIGRYAFISAFCAVSNTTIGDYTFVGLNTMIGPGVKIGKNCIIGANSYVKNNLPDNVIAVGSPAKIIKENKSFHVAK